jgi:hypothetical protein
MGAPGCPELAFWTASIASPLIVHELNCPTSIGTSKMVRLISH